MAKHLWPALLIALVPLAASAQTPDAGWQGRPPVGKNVVVTQTDQQRIKGQLASVTDTAIRLKLPEGVRDIPLERVATIRHRDLRPLKYGLLLGAGVGFAVGWIREASCGGQCMSYVGGLEGALIGTAIGGGVGAALSLRERLDYRAPTQSTVSLVPMLSRRAPGLAIAVSF